MKLFPIPNGLSPCRVDREPCWDGHGSPQSTFSLKQVKRSSQTSPFQVLGCWPVLFTLLPGCKSSNNCWKILPPLLETHQKSHGDFLQALGYLSLGSKENVKRNGFFLHFKLSTNFSPVAFIHFLTLPNAFRWKNGGPQFIVDPPDSL